MSSARLPVAVFIVIACVSLQALAEEVAINLGPEELVRADGNDLVVPGYAVPSFEDWNGDQIEDLIVGEGGNGFAGKVRVYLNVGTEADPCFVDSFYVQSNGQDLTCTPNGCQGCFPRVVYWDEDARKDLLIGLADGTAKIFLNVASDNEPAFDAGQNVTVGNESAYTFDVGSRATPIMVHWNDDDMLDIVSGGLDGLIHVYYNCGCGGGAVPPHFYFSPPDGTYAQDKSRDLQVPGGRSSPVVMDLDGDGKKDLLTGNTDGMILFFRNTGTNSLPMFSGYSPVQSNGQPIDLPNGFRSRPSVCYWTGENDGYWDLLVGYGDGKVHLYRGIPKRGDFDADGALDADDFTFIAKALNQPLPPQGTPADLNADGAVDILDLQIFADLWLAANK